MNFEEKCQVRKYMEIIANLEEGKFTEDRANDWAIIKNIISGFKSKSIQEKLYNFYNSPSPLSELRNSINIPLTENMDKDSITKVMESMVSLYVSETNDNSIKKELNIHDKVRLSNISLQEMSIRHIRGGYAVSVDNEENALIDKIVENKNVSKNELTEREQEVARKLTSRGLLRRYINNENIVYKYNGLDDVWR